MDAPDQGAPSSPVDPRTSREGNVELRPRSRVRTWIVLALLVALVEIAHVFIISAGSFVRWPTYSNYYDLLAEGFRSGHLSLPIAPAPELLAKQDPFDPANARLWLWDASLHDGKYYLYWGPLPALIQAAAKSALGISRPVGDQYLLFGFCFLYVLFGTLILERMARRLFPGLPLSLLIAAVLVFAFANPIPHSLASPAIYQTAILGGQAFLLAGLSFAFDAVWLAARGESPRRHLWIAGTAWALALACRISLAPAVLLLLLATAMGSTRVAPGRTLRALPNLACLAAPVALGLCLLLLYNEQRFGSWLEFGTGLQLSTMAFHTSSSYIPLNLYSYALRPFQPTGAFPFALQVREIGARGFPSWLAIGPGYSTREPVVGFLVAVPWSWLAPLAVLAYGRRRRRTVSPPELAEPEIRARVGRWCASSFAILVCATSLPVITMFIATMRYLADVTAGLTLAGVLGAWWMYRHVAKGNLSRRVVHASCTALAAATIVLGLLLGIQGYEGHFRTYNPDLFDEMVNALSITNVVPHVSHASR